LVQIKNDIVLIVVVKRSAWEMEMMAAAAAAEALRHGGSFQSA